MWTKNQKALFGLSLACRKASNVGLAAYTALQNGAYDEAQKLLFWSNIEMGLIVEEIEQQRQNISPLSQGVNVQHLHEPKVLSEQEIKKIETERKRQNKAQGRGRGRGRNNGRNNNNNNNNQGRGGRGRGGGNWRSNSQNSTGSKSSKGSQGKGKSPKPPQSK